MAIYVNIFFTVQTFLLLYIYGSTLLSPPIITSGPGSDLCSYIVYCLSSVIHVDTVRTYFK